MFDPNGPTLFELARQALSSTTEGYDLLAPKFEWTPFRTPDVLIQPMADAAAAASANDVLDLGCGTGAVTRAMAKVAKGRVLGVDLSEGMLSEARRRAADQSLACEFEQMDLFEMAFESEFDVVTTSGAFGHILPPDQRKFVDLVWRALRPGGLFIFITGPMPKKNEAAYWVARGFNAAMHVRNALKRPPFVMFYLTFTLERATQLLWERGFEVRVDSPFTAFEFQRARLVIARKVA